MKACRSLLDASTRKSLGIKYASSVKSTPGISPRPEKKNGMRYLHYSRKLDAKDDRLGEIPCEREKAAALRK